MFQMVLQQLFNSSCNSTKNRITHLIIDDRTPPQWDQGKGSKILYLEISKGLDAFSKLEFPDAGRKNFTTVEITRYQMEPQLSNTSCNKDIKSLDSDLTQIQRIKNCVFSNPQLHSMTFEIQILPLTIWILICSPLSVQRTFHHVCIGSMRGKYSQFQAGAAWMP